MAKKRTILIVDDEIDFSNMIRIRLEAKDYSVIIANDGEEGLKRAQTEKPDVILLDVLMPGKDGYTMMRELKLNDDTKDIPVIVVTAKTGMSDLFKVEGIDNYLVKPFDDKELLKRIEKVLKD